MVPQHNAQKEQNVLTTSAGKEEQVKVQCSETSSDRVLDKTKM